jgi:hypothetical protein
LFRTPIVTSGGESQRDQESNGSSAAQGSHGGAPDPQAVTSSLQARVLDSLCHTVAQLLAFVVDETGNDLHGMIFLDLVYLLEDCGILEGSTSSSASSILLPAHVDIFRETTLAGNVRQRAAEGSDENHRQTTDQAVHPLKQYTLNLHDVDDVHLLQTSVLKILHMYVLDTASDRLKYLPETVVASPSPPSEGTASDGTAKASPSTDDGCSECLPGGDYDLVFPPGSIHDNDMLSSLLVALKPVLLLWPEQAVRPKSSGRMDDAFASYLDAERKCTAAEMLVLLAEDWHCSESGPPWCVVETAILVTRAVQAFVRHCGLQKLSLHQRDEPVPPLNLGYDSRLAMLVDRAILNPPPTFATLATSNIHTPTLTVFLDCLEGMAVRLGQRHGTRMLVDIKILQTIHTVTVRCPDLLPVAVDYSMSKDLFRYLFVLLVPPPSAALGGSRSILLPFLALQVLERFLRSLMAISFHGDGPSNYEAMVSNACWQARNQHLSNVTSFDDGDGEGSQNPPATDSKEVETTNQSDVATTDRVPGGESSLTSDVAAVGTKRKLNALSPGSTRRNKQARSPLQPLSLSPTKRRATVKPAHGGTTLNHQSDVPRDAPQQKAALFPFPCAWSEALSMFLCHALDAGRNLERSLIRAPCARLDGEDGDNDIHKCLEDAGRLCSGLRLLLGLVQAGTIIDVEISGLAQQLVEYLLRSCDSLTSRFTVVAGEKEPVYVELADLLLRCGFSIYCAVPSCAAPSEGSAEGEIRGKFLHSVACLSLRIIQESPKITLGVDSTADICWHCAGIPPYFLRNKDGTLSSGAKLGGLCHSRCFDRVAAGADCSLAVLDALPLYTKAVLYASLNPVSDNPVEGSMAKRHEQSVKFFGQHSFNVFIGCIYTGLGSKCDETATETVSHMAALTAPLLHLLPLLAGPRELEGTHRNASASLGSTVSSELTEMPRSKVVQFLQSILDPVMEAVKAGNQYVFQSLIAAMSHLQDSPTSNEVQVACPSAVLGYAQCRYRHLSGRHGPQVDEAAWLGTDIITLAPKIGSTECPRSRYLLWMCLVRYCRSTSPCDLRQQLFRSSTTLEPTAGADGGIFESTTGTDGGISLKDVLYSLLAVPFSDSDYNLRCFSSQEIIPLLTTKDYSFLMSCFATDEDFQDFCIYSRREGEDRSEQSTFKLLQASDNVVAGLFRQIDSLLDENCGLSGSQLSLTMARPSAREAGQTDRKGLEDRLSLQYSAACVLSSMCSVADLSNPIGKNIFEKALLRLMRIWATSAMGKGTDLAFPDLQSTTGSKALAFAAMASLSQSRDLSICLSEHRLWTYFPGAIFSDIILLNNASSREEQFVLLEKFLLSFLSGTENSLEVRTSFDTAVDLVEDALPSMIAQFVNENDDELLRLTCSFRLFIKDNRRSKNATWSEQSLVIGRSNAARTQRRSGALMISQKAIHDTTKDMCLGLMDEVLPLVLISSDQHEALPLKFLTRVIAPRTLTDVVKSREQKILKGIAWELGANPYKVGSVVRGMRTAALACQSGEGGEVVRKEMLSGTVAAQTWVTKHFMYLVVNLVQHNWNAKTALERLQALRCLFVLLDFLDPMESAQYFPQVLATFNAGITENSARRYNVVDDIPGHMYLRLEATKCLAKFVRVASKHHLTTVVDNLTTIVVSLIPVLEDERIHIDKVRTSAIEEARDEAVALLEFLTRGEIVRRFRREFSEIPFLPASPALDAVHKSLREHGVDFDNLLILSTSTTTSQYGTRRDSLTTDTGSKVISVTRNTDKISALQKRLAMICPLLDNENTSVRSVAMQHLVDLLRANRESFHILLDNEGSVSIRNYVTVRFAEGANGKFEVNGNVTDMVERLIRRSTIETDPEVVVRLATCLGEIGAIGEHRLEDVSLFKSSGDESLALYRWRLDKPPWQARATKYELQLVSKLLVTALKAARSSEEQHRIAFAIQQLLVLLDTAGRQNEKESIAKEAQTGKKREMSKWLLNQLVEAKVYDTVEPFWLSEFKEKVS